MIIRVQIVELEWFAFKQPYLQYLKSLDQSKL